ncbi:MAG: glutamine--fructose-6-phosphate transaminase (isomerizing) [Candidatus Peribacteraceae bacterium]|nr:glutamine--fructose-6-phosphate transaminase (isomerizing) [Candidatus Peribacteraceae bacterium]MDD5742970.1 glutamine--fructose-6-phosphate transaminase (isomerizing) [Candidatus Peribacteraceae bacterium]
MCGIIGYVGKRTDAGFLVVEGLKHLEYRGYDSWGVACKTGDGIIIRKDIGKISTVNPAEFLQSSSLAMAHTRWATHGGVTPVNAHPHVSCDGKIVVVLNGIIENFESLREALKAKGHRFVSTTDTEVIPHLIEEEMKTEQDFAAAVRRACLRFEGRYGIVALHADSSLLVAARTGSPLIVGVAEDGYFVASDTPAFLEHTATVQYLDDGEMVVTDGTSILFSDLRTGEERTKREIPITWSTAQSQKGEYEHYMLKEIMEQKQSIARAVDQDIGQIETLARAILEAQGTFLVGCGTAAKACMAAEYFFSVIAGHHVNFAPASEFKLYHRFLKPESLLIAVSQSGETADTLEAMKIAKSKGAKVLAIVNAEGSTIAREADFTLHINAGPERAVASTKALTGQMAVLLLIAYAMIGKLPKGRTRLLETAAAINDMLNPRYTEFIEGIAEHIQQSTDLYIIGKGWNYPMALESAIKIQEVSYVHAEGFAGGELKHGPIALIEKGTPCIALVGNDEVRTDIISNAIELKARGGFIIGIAPERNDVFDEWIKVPNVDTAQAIVNIIPVQVLAYFLAVKRGKDPDMPRNLAKSVTVK